MTKYKWEISVPVFDVVLFVLVSNDPSAARDDAELVAAFGPNEEGNDWDAICLESNDTDTFCIIFDERRLDAGLLAHELWHLTCSILRHHSISCEETGALLHGYLTNVVSKALKRWI